MERAGLLASMKTGSASGAAAGSGSSFSQIPESSSVLQLPDHHFADVYGWEWFVRWGDPGPLEGLGAGSP